MHLSKWNTIQFQEWLEGVLQHQALILGIFSAPRDKKGERQKVSVRPVLLKQGLQYQASEQREEKVFHVNLALTESAAWMTGLWTEFQQATFFTTEADFTFTLQTEGQLKIQQKAPTKTQVPLSHNRKKEYLLSEGEPIPFLVELGLMNKEGRIYPQKTPKFRQINRFLEMVRDTLPSLDAKHPIHIVDVGCGKAYLTFALYHYLHDLLGYDVRMVGLDLKRDVMTDCQALAEKIGYSNLRFIQGNVSDYKPEHPIEMLVALHACDTATDIALAKGIRWGARVILAAPCCQHELLAQVQHPDLEPLLKYGILKERFSALVTDAARAQLLESCGYQTQILEFIDFEHTPKNLLIRATKAAKGEPDHAALEKYLAFKKALHISPTLEKLMKNSPLSQ